jgi:hypothetical protein
MDRYPSNAAPQVLPTPTPSRRKRRAAAPQKLKEATAGQPFELVAKVRKLLAKKRNSQLPLAAGASDQTPAEGAPDTQSAPATSPPVTAAAKASADAAVPGAPLGLPQPARATSAATANAEAAAPVVQVPRILLDHMRRKVQENGVPDMAVEPAAAVFVEAMMQTVLTTFLDTIVEQARQQQQQQQNQQQRGLCSTTTASSNDSGSSSGVPNGNRVMIHPRHIQDAVQYSSDLRDLVLGNAVQRPQPPPRPPPAPPTSPPTASPLQQDQGARSGAASILAMDPASGVVHDPSHGSRGSATTTTDAMADPVRQSLSMPAVSGLCNNGDHASTARDFTDSRGHSTCRNEHDAALTPASAAAAAAAASAHARNGNCNSSSKVRRGHVAEAQVGREQAPLDESALSCNARVVQGQTIVLDNVSTTSLATFPPHLPSDSTGVAIPVHVLDCSADVGLAALASAQPSAFAFAAHFEAAARSAAQLAAVANHGTVVRLGNRAEPPQPRHDDVLLAAATESAAGGAPKATPSPPSIRAGSSDPFALTVVLGGCVGHVAATATSLGNGHVTYAQFRELRAYCQRAAVSTDDDAAAFLPLPRHTHSTAERSPQVFAQPPMAATAIAGAVDNAGDGAVWAGQGTRRVTTADAGLPSAAAGSVSTPINMRPAAASADRRVRPAAVTAPTATTAFSMAFPMAFPTMHLDLHSLARQACWPTSSAAALSALLPTTADVRGAAPATGPTPPAAVAVSWLENQCIPHGS